MKKRGAIYARQSRTRDGSESIAIQLETGRETATRFDIDVVAELVEPPSTSAYKNRGRSRRKFGELLDLTAGCAIDCVIVYKTDRLSRGGGPGWAPLLDAIEAAGQSASQFVITPSGWVNEFELSIRSAMDREESKKISERMIDVRALEAREGKPRTAICRGYGYEYSKVTKQLTLIDAEADIIRECVRRVIGGETVYSVARDLSRRGVPTVTGSHRWSTTTLLTILRSGRIAGLRCHHGEAVAVGQWEAIITVAEHEHVMAVTAKRPGRSPRRAARTFPLIGYLTCGKCGQPLRSQTGQDRRRYACRTGDNLGGCGGIQVSAPAVEEAVRQYVCATLAHPATRQKLAAAMPRPDGKQHDRLFSRIRALDLKRQRLTDLTLDGALPPSEYRRKQAELVEELTELEHALASVPEHQALVALPSTLAEVQERWDQRGIDYQRLLVSLTIDMITVHPAVRAGPKFNPERLEWHLRG